MRCSKRFSTITNRKSKTAYELEAYMEKKNMISKIKNHKLCCIVIILALLGGGGFGIYKFFFQKKQPQKTVQTQKATTGTIEKTVEGSGSVKAITQNVTFSSDVTVQSVLKKDGAAVKKGDVIAKLTSSDLEDSITQLESQIETLEDTIEGSDSSDDDYASNVRKYKDLTMKLSTLKTERSNLTVTSKYNGIVSGTITKGKTISKGQSVTVTADAVEDKTFTGKVTKVSKVGSTSDGVATYPVTIQLSNAADLLSSMSVTATITTAKASGNSSSVTLKGITEEYEDIQNISVQKGRYILDVDNDNRLQVCLIGVTAAKDLFGHTDVEGETIRISGRNFKIIEVLEEDGSSQRDPNDSVIYNSTKDHAKQHDQQFLCICNK